MKKRFLAILSIIACMSLSAVAPVTAMNVSAETADEAAASQADTGEDGTSADTSADGTDSSAASDGSSSDASTTDEAASEEEQIADYYSFYTDPWIEAWFSGDKSSLDSVDSQYGVTDSYKVDDSEYKELVKSVGERVSDEKATGSTNEDQTVYTIVRTVNCKEKSVDFTFTFDTVNQTFAWTVEPQASTSDLVAKAGLNTLLGMGTVFIVLIFISFVISLFKLFSKTDKKKTVVNNEPVLAAKPAESAPVIAQSVQDTQSDDEIIAVISAAIAAYEDDLAGNGQEVPADGLIVRSIKKRGFN